MQSSGRRHFHVMTVISLVIILFAMTTSPVLGSEGITAEEETAADTTTEPVAEPVVEPEPEPEAEPEVAPEPAPEEAAPVEEPAAAAEDTKSAPKKFNLTTVGAGTKSSLSRRVPLVQPTDPGNSNNNAGGPGDLKIVDATNGNELSINGNNPHVPCLPFKLKFEDMTGFANTTINWTVSTVHPTTPLATIQTGSTLLDASGDGLSIAVPVDSLLINGFEKHEGDGTNGGQGYHVTIDLDDSSKKKTIWVDCNPGTLTIAKEIASNSPQTQNFDFHLNGATAVLDTLTDGENTGALTVTPGVNTVAEDLPARWLNPTVACTGAVAYSTTGATLSVTVGVSNVTCTFTNEKEAPSADLAVTKTDNDADDSILRNSEQIVYTVTMSNAGPDSATNAVLTDTLPSGLTLVSAVWSGTDASCTDGTLTCTVPTFATTDSLVLTVTATGNTNGTHRNSAAVSSATGDSVTTNNSAFVDTTVTPAADLALTKSDDADPAFVGDVVTYTLSITNNGPDDATNVFVTDVLPAALDLVDAELPENCTSEAGELATTIVTCSLGTVTAGGTPTITLEVTALAEGTLTNHAEVVSGFLNQQIASRVSSIVLPGGIFDPNTANNFDDETTTISPRVVLIPVIPTNPTSSADLSIVKSDSGDPVDVGDPLNYTLTISNSGPDASGTVTVTDTIPSGTSLVSATSTTATCTTSGATVTCTNPSLASGGSFTVSIETLAVAEGVLTNTATATSTAPDPNLTNNTDAEQTTIGSSDATRIIVEKQTLPNGETDTFTFVGDIAATLGDDQSASADVAPGTYTVTEPAAEGWDLTTIQCLDSDGTGVASSGDVDQATATFNVEEFETVTCVFTNVKEEVLGEVIDKDPKPKPEPEVQPRAITKPEALPFTGSEPTALALLAMLAIVTGLVLAFRMPRRRRARSEE